MTDLIQSKIILLYNLHVTKHKEKKNSIDDTGLIMLMTLNKFLSFFDMTYAHRV